MVRESIGIRPTQTWVRGRAFTDGNEIVLAGAEAEEYVAFQPDHAVRLLFDLADLQNLADFSVYPNLRITDPQRALDFVEEYGLLWHGPKHLGNGECREFLGDWVRVGFALGFGFSLYMTIEKSVEEDSAEPVRSYLRMLRDANRWHRVPLPDDDTELLEYASIQLAEHITRGMTECTPTFVAECALVEDGKRVGSAGDFVFGNAPGSLVGAAYYTLAGLISRKERFKNCEGCGRMFQLEHGSQRFCEKKCATRKRQRDLRNKNRSAL